MRHDLRSPSPPPSPSPSPAKIGVVVGAILGLLGTMAGFFFGVIRPAMISGRWHELPTHSIWLGGAIMTAIIVACTVYLVRWFRGPQTHRNAGEDDW